MLSKKSMSGENQYVSKFQAMGGEIKFPAHLKEEDHVAFERHVRGMVRTLGKLSKAKNPPKPRTAAQQAATAKMRAAREQKRASAAVGLQKPEVDSKAERQRQFADTGRKAFG